MKAILDAEIAAFISEHKCDPFNGDFIFGHNEDWTRIRNRTIAITPNGPITMLSAMLRYGLDETKRINLFKSTFDLGNPKRIPKDQLTLVNLAKKVRKERHQLDDPATRKKEFQSILEALKEVTGKRFGEYADKQISLRVIYLLDKLMVHPKYAIEGRKERLLTFIKSPTSKFSFEVRSAYPIVDSEGNTQLLNDLKSYIGIEIDLETLDRIDSVFNPLINRLDSVRSHLDQVAHASGERANVVDVYRTMHALINAIEIPRVSSQLQEPSRLDQDLYIHLHRIEFLHYVGEHRRILEELAEPSSNIKAIRHAMIEVLSAMTGGERNYGEITKEIFLLNEFANLTEIYAGTFLKLIEVALGFRPSETQYARITSLSEELLYRVKFFGRDALISRDKVLVSFREIISALCAVAQATKFRTKYRPKIFRRTDRTRSIITPLETQIDMDGSGPLWEIQEGYLQLWHNRREWVQDALEGNQDVAALKFGLRNLLWTKAVQCVSFNDVTLMEQALLKLETSLLCVHPGNLHGPKA